MRRIAKCLFPILCLLLCLTGCIRPSGTVRCRSRLKADRVASMVQLSDGELIFVEEYPTYRGIPITTAPSYKVIDYACYSYPECMEWQTFSYEDTVEYIQCDILQVLRDADVSERCIPEEDDFVTDGYVLTEDTEWGKREFHAGARWGGDVYVISYAPDEEYPRMKRQMGIAINYAGEFTGLEFKQEVWSKEPNSRVGDIPVYVNYAHCQASSLGGWDTEEFFACFQVAGYSCAVYSLDHTQQEFVDVLLAIINHYGAYTVRATAS